MKRSVIFSFLIFVLSAEIWAQQTRGIVELPQMQVLAQDVYVESRFDSAGKRIGVDIFVRKKSQIESVMLVETTKDPNGKEPNYCYRAAEWNETNGDEIRYLDGKELKSDYAKFSLISSTAKKNARFGEAFQIFIPNTIYYGYPWSRNGTVQIGKGVFINIRTFEKPYGDYNGRYMDNPFMFDFAEKKKSGTEIPAKIQDEIPSEENPREIPETEPAENSLTDDSENSAEKTDEKISEEKPIILTDDYNSAAAEKFGELAEDGSGILYYSNLEKLADDLVNSVAKISAKKADVVFAIDTTGSMKNDMEILRKEWIPKFAEQLKKFDDLRVGLLFYRDFNDSYNYKGLPVKYFAFTKDIARFEKDLNSAVIHGNEGGDIPEAVYEAIFASINFYDWRKDAFKKIILVGDAEPHAKPKGPKKITQEKVMAQAKEKEIVLDCIIVPDEK